MILVWGLFFFEEWAEGSVFQSNWLSLFNSMVIQVVFTLSVSVGHQHDPEPCLSPLLQSCWYQPTMGACWWPWGVWGVEPGPGMPSGAARDWAYPKGQSRRMLPLEQMWDPSWDEAGLSGAAGQGQKHSWACASTEPVREPSAGTPLISELRLEVAWPDLHSHPQGAGSAHSVGSSACCPSP